MEVISIKNTKKLVKGAKYQVLEMRNSGTNTSRRPHIKLKDLGWFHLRDFKPVGSESFSKIDWKDPNIIESEEVKYIHNPQTLKKGDLLVCLRKGSVYLQVGNFYKVEDVKVEQVNRWTIVKVKIYGYNRWLSHYSFRLASQHEIRTISLQDIFEQTRPDTSIDLKVRLIDKMPPIEREDLILSATLRSVLDPWRNSMDIIDWAINKIEPNYKLKREDFSCVLGKTIQEICNLKDKITNKDN